MTVRWMHGGRRTFAAGAVAGVLAGGVLAGGMAFASIPTSGTGVIYACRSIVTGTGFGTARIID